MMKIDYEATGKLIQKDRSGTHSCNPICAKCIGYVHRYVDAAVPDDDLWVMVEPTIPFNLHADIRTGIDLAKEYGVLVKGERGNL